LRCIHRPTSYRKTTLVGKDISVLRCTSLPTSYRNRGLVGMSGDASVTRHACSQSLLTLSCASAQPRQTAPVFSFLIACARAANTTSASHHSHCLAARARTSSGCAHARTCTPVSPCAGLRTDLRRQLSRKGAGLETHHRLTSHRRREQVRAHRPNAPVGPRIARRCPPHVCVWPPPDLWPVVRDSSWLAPPLSSHLSAD